MIDLDFIDTSNEYRERHPSGVPSGGRPLRGLAALIYADYERVGLAKHLVDLQRFSDAAPKYYVIAVSSDHGIERAYMLSRIVEMVMMETGEVVERIEGQPIGGQAAVEQKLQFDAVKACLPQIDVLMFVATLSAGMRDSQVALLADFILSKTHNAADHGTWTRFVERRTAPNPVGFREALKCIPFEHLDDLIATARAILAKVKRSAEMDVGVVRALEITRERLGRR